MRPAFKTLAMIGLSLALFPALAGCVAGESRWEGYAEGGSGILGDAPPYLNPFKRMGSGGIDPASRNRQAVGAVDFGVSGDRSGPSVRPASAPGDLTLNFVNVEIQDFLRSVFDELLKEPVVVDPNIRGLVTVRSPDPVNKATALDMVRSALDTYGLQLQKRGNVYHVTQRNAGAGPRVRGSGDIRSLRLQHISAEQARTALQPFGQGQVEISASGDGRTLLFSGSGADVDGLMQVAAALDVDQMRGTAFALLPLREAGAQAVSQELNQMFGGREGSGTGSRAMAIARINAVLITARSRDQLGRMQAWARRLDQGGRDTRRVNVYQLQNRRANEVAQILQGMFGSEGGARQQQGRGVVAPGLTPAATTVTGAAPGAGAAAGTMQVASMASGAPPATTGNPEDTVPPQYRNDRPGEEQAGLASTAVAIRADNSTNSIVVIARPEDYRIVESAIRRLDVLPSQVLIEATIVEVGLNDALRHGVRWFLQSGNHGAFLTDSPAGSFANVNPGFNYTFTAGGSRLVVNALERITDVEIVSSPALTVLDNQTANLKIGDQVPIATRSARSVTNPDSPIVNDIEMKDTGIILSVTPRVNAAGLVLLDISQEASDVVPTTTSNIDSPTIRQRKINSSVAVQSGDEIVLGGIISRRKAKGKEGVPGLMHIPILGAAFTSLGTNEQARTELLIIIRPTVVNSRQDLQILTQEIRARLPRTTRATYR
jgi:general secretion pathway protein D